MISGHFVLIDPGKPADKAVLKRVRAVPGDGERNERIKRELLRNAGEGCFVDFRADEAAD